MLKIGKGLKKKKKNKKGKNEELFTEAELEQYRKEHAQKPPEESCDAEQPESSSKGGSEDFEKFKLLTAGVDDILRKSQGDLDRIKKDSFFQRKPTPSELKAQEEKERAEYAKGEGDWVGFSEQKPEEGVKEKEIAFDFEEESESELEDNDDIFDTAYVDALESGEVKLAYVPDDDELEVDSGPDPFDTSTADELLRKAEEEEKRKKKEISLGLAVTVLSGRAERDKALLNDTPDSVEERKTPKARPRKIQDFCLLGSFDESSVKEVKVEEKCDSGAAAAVVPTSLLDEEVDVEGDLPEGDVLITEVLVKQVARPPPPELATPVEGQDILEEFSVPVVNPIDAEIKKLEEEEEFDEFSALAASSVANQKLEEELHQYEVDADDPFDTSVVEAVLTSAPPDLLESIEKVSRQLPVQAPCRPPPPSTPWSAFEDIAEETDPFDTAFADNCAPGKVELRLLEREILEAVPPAVARRIDAHLEARILSRTNSDDVNNTRDASDKAAGKVSIHITNPSGETQRGSESEEIVALSLSHRDLLGGSTTDLSSLGDQPLPPSTGEESISYSDPFDTTLAEQASAPGRVELKYIETELLSDIPSAICDDDFDPRSEEVRPRGVSFDIPSPISSGLLISGREEAIGPRPLTPYYADSPTTEPDSDIAVEDPFDTSHVSALPGKQELKLIEEELSSSRIDPALFQPIHEKLGVDPDAIQVGLKHSLSDQDFDPRGESDQQLQIQPPAAARRFSDISGLQRQPRPLLIRSSLSEDKPDLLVVEEELPDKALTPAIEEDISSYIDPFDTTIAENIAPGKAELKVLEVELVGSISRSYTDPDFNPRDAPISDGKLKAVPGTKVLQPLDVTEVNEEIDPFDTSIASNIGPGKAELRLLESELVG